MDKTIKSLGLVGLTPAETRKVNGGVHMSAQNRALLSDLLTVHQDIVTLRSDRATLYQYKQSIGI